MRKPKKKDGAAVAHRTVIKEISYFYSQKVPFRKFDDFCSWVEKWAGFGQLALYIPHLRLHCGNLFFFGYK